MRAGGRGTSLIGASLFFLLSLFFFFLGAPAAEEPGLLLTETRQMGLGDSFFRDGDFYRAITEYRRFLYLFPESPRADEALFKIGRSYFQGRRWDEAIAAFGELEKKFPLTRFATQALLLAGRSFMEKKDYPAARRLFLSVKGIAPDSPEADEGQMDMALAYLREERYKEAAEAFRQVSRSSRLHPSADYLAAGLDRISDLPGKSPAGAGLLAALLPGTGHLYVGRYRDAAVAFALNAAFIAGAIEAFRRESYVVAGILTFFELGWYSGNIYSAVSSAHKYNRQMKQDYLDRLEREGLSLGVSSPRGGLGIALRYVY
ncbi:MAG: tetratricopeptide repeat protein [Deltaproteobacteria bacterium]|nr:tetratricopeptide repeat protein [Deltaproteobacteria bacterium]